MYSKKYPAFYRVTPSKAKNRTQIFTLISLLQQPTNQITPLASTLEKPESFTASTYARIARISTITRSARISAIATIARINTIARIVRIVKIVKC